MSLQDGLGLDLTGVANAMQVGMVIVDAQQQVALWNDWIAERSGISAENAIGNALLSLFPSLEGNRLIQAIDQALKHNLPALLSPALHKTPLPLYSSENDKAHNRRIQQLIHIVPLKSETGAATCLIQVNDMTNGMTREMVLRHQAEELRRANFIDALTGIANRRKFDETLAKEFHRAQRTQTPIALIIADIDHFKDYNDFYGHPQGDQCLTRVAQALQDTLRRAGDLVTRYGGEEFGIILPNTSQSTAAAIAENLRIRVSTLTIPHENSPVAPIVSVSLGVAAIVPEIGADFHALVSAADVALYEAKHNGRNQAIYMSIQNGSYHACA